MNLKGLRQIFKALGDDTRLRIVNILLHEELTVTDICSVLTLNQPSVSKHLVTLKFLKIVNDRRKGNCIYYSLSDGSAARRIINFVLDEFYAIEVFKTDKEKLKVLGR